MDILNKIPIVVEADSINDAYQSLLRKFRIINRKYFSKTAILVIKNIYCSQLPCKVIEPYNEYYRVFFQNSLLEKKWNLLDKEWYLSYARRIMKERNGIVPWNKAKQEILSNKYSRRCVINTYSGEDDYLNYMPALLAIQFIVENDKLNMLTYWRSKELYTALPVNILCMHSLMRLMLNELKLQYKTLEMGIYTEIIGSLHILPESTIPSQFGDSLKNMDLQKVKFLWSVLDYGKENEYDENY